MAGRVNGGEKNKDCLQQSKILCLSFKVFCYFEAEGFGEGLKGVVF